MIIKTIILDKKRIELFNSILSDYNIHPRVKRKVNVILLKSQGKTIKEIMSETNLSKRTIIKYTQEYNNSNDSIGELSFIHRNKYKTSILDTIKNDENRNIYDDFKTNKPVSYKEATQRIKNKYHIFLSESAVRRYLRKKNIYTKRSKRPIYIKNKKENKNR